MTISTNNTPSPQTVGELFSQLGLTPETLDKLTKTMGELAANLPPVGDGEAAAGQAAAQGNLLPALAAPIVAAGALSLEQLVDALNMEERKTAVKTGTESLKAKGQERQEAWDKKMEEVRKQIEQMNKEAKLGPFAKIFKFIGMIIGALVSAATIALGAVTGNPLMVAGGVMLAAMTINSIMSEASGGKVSISAGVGALAKACGASDEVAQWIGFGVEMGATIVAAALTMGGSFAGASKELITAAQKLVDKVANIVSKVGSIAQGVVDAGEGALGIAQSVFESKITRSQADQKELEAILERIREASDNWTDFLKSAMERSQQLTENVKEIIDGSIETQTAIQTGLSPAMA